MGAPEKLRSEGENGAEKKNIEEESTTKWYISTLGGDQSLFRMKAAHFQGKALLYYRSGERKLFAPICPKERVYYLQVRK